VKSLAPALEDDCVWVSEGSREIGASAGFAFYLRHCGSIKSSNVLIMSDDVRRPPPSYPGATPKYLIDHAQLEKIWASDRPVIFITDFQREDMDSDKPMLPTQDCRNVPVRDGGQRRVYANSYAWKKLVAAGLTQVQASNNMSKRAQCPRDLLLPFFPAHE